MKVRDLVSKFSKTSEEELIAVLEEAYARGYSARVLPPTEQEHEALLVVLGYAKQVEPRGATDWEAQHLAGAIEHYDATSCKTPTGERAHGSFIKRNDKGDTICTFCHVPIHRAKRTKA